MRAVFQLKYNGRQFWVKSFDGVKIDCMILPGSGASQMQTHRTISCEDLGRSSSLTRQNSPSSLGPWFVNHNLEVNPNVPTMVFCNPNASVYELLSMQSEWLEYYINLGVNLVVWNYRGYGRSKQGCKLLRISNI